MKVVRRGDPMPSFRDLPRYKDPPLFWVWYQDLLLPVVGFDDAGPGGTKEVMVQFPGGEGKYVPRTDTQEADWFQIRDVARAEQRAHLAGVTEDELVLALLDRLGGSAMISGYDLEKVRQEGYVLDRSRGETYVRLRREKKA